MKYLYCIIPDNKQQTFDVQGIGGQAYTIPYEDVSLVVSDSEPVSFTAISKEELVKYLLTHQSTIEKIMQKYSVIPLKFGTFLDNEEETQKIVRKGYKLFKESLEALKDKIELDLVASWSDMRGVLKEIAEMPEIKRLKDEISAKPLAERIKDGILLGKRVKDLLDQKKDQIAREIIASLSAKDPPQAGKGGFDFCKHAVLNDAMISNTAFLVAKDKKGDFEARLEELDKKFSAKGGSASGGDGLINFKLVGPLPPYSFATFEVDKLTKDEIAYAKAFLGVNGDPKPQEVKEAYHAMALKLHPDKNPDNPHAQKDFEELKKAFDILLKYSNNGQDLLLVKNVGTGNLSLSIE